MLVGKHAIPAHFDVEGNCNLWVEIEASDEGVVCEDIGDANLVEDGKSVGGWKRGKAEGVKE